MADCSQSVNTTWAKSAPDATLSSSESAQQQQGNVPTLAEKEPMTPSVLSTCQPTAFVPEHYMPKLKAWANAKFSSPGMADAVIEMMCRLIISSDKTSLPLTPEEMIERLETSMTFVDVVMCKYAPKETTTTTLSSTTPSSSSLSPAEGTASMTNPPLSDNPASTKDKHSDRYMAAIGETLLNGLNRLGKAVPTEPAQSSSPPLQPRGVNPQSPPEESPSFARPGMPRFENFVPFTGRPINISVKFDALSPTDQWRDALFSVLGLAGAASRMLLFMCLVAVAAGGVCWYLIHTLMYAIAQHVFVYQTHPIVWFACVLLSLKSTINLSRQLFKTFILVPCARVGQDVVRQWIVGQDAYPVTFDIFKAVVQHLVRQYVEDKIPTLRCPSCE